MIFCMKIFIVKSQYLCGIFMSLCVKIDIKYIQKYTIFIWVFYVFDAEKGYRVFIWFVIWTGLHNIIMMLLILK